METDCICDSNVKMNRLPLIVLLDFLYMKESALYHFKSAGILAEGFGSTPEMSRRNLIWVVYRMQIVVDGFPSW